MTVSFSNQINLLLMRSAPDKFIGDPTGKVVRNAESTPQMKLSHITVVLSDKELDEAFLIELAKTYLRDGTVVTLKLEGTDNEKKQQ